MSADKTTPFEDVAKALPKLPTLAGLSLLCVDAAGALKKSDAAMLQIHSGLYSDDLNDVQGFGIYRLGNQGANWPMNAGGMIMIHLNIYQLVFRAGDGGNIFFRAKSEANGWQPWKTVV